LSKPNKAVALFPTGKTAIGRPFLASHHPTP
jgi:hypothetical protein